MCGFGVENGIVAWCCCYTLYCKELLVAPRYYLASLQNEIPGFSLGCCTCEDSCARGWRHGGNRGDSLPFGICGSCAQKFLDILEITSWLSIFHSLSTPSHLASQCVGAGVVCGQIMVMLILRHFESSFVQPKIKSWMDLNLSERFDCTGNGFFFQASERTKIRPVQKLLHFWLLLGMMRI